MENNGPNNYKFSMENFIKNEDFVPSLKPRYLKQYNL